MGRSAIADTFTLKFEDIVPNPDDQVASVGDFYNGAGGAANNFGVTFSSNALAVCLNTSSVFCTGVSRGGEGDPTSQSGGLTFLDDNEIVLNYAAGFVDVLSFYYTNVNVPSTVSIYSGLNGTGTLLASMNLSLTSWPCGPPYDATFCPFAATGLPFDGTAQSVVFFNSSNDQPQLVLDDITLTTEGGGGNNPGAVPEPSTLVMLLTGAATAGAGLGRRLLTARR